MNFLELLLRTRSYKAAHTAVCSQHLYSHPVLSEETAIYTYQLTGALGF